MSIYEVHLGSWMKKNKVESLSYREMAEPLAAYAQNMGFTHVEFLPGGRARLLSLLGLPGDRLLRADQPVTARRTIFNSWSTTSIRPAWAC